MIDWKSKVVPGAVLVVVVGGVALLIGRSTGKAGTTSTSAAAASSLPAPGEPDSAWRDELPPKPQHFDLQEDPRFQAGLPLRSMDREIFDRLNDPNLKRDDLSDLLPNKPYRARAVGSVDLKVYGAVLIDEDRDGKWDERWTLKGDQVIRTTLPNAPTAPSDPERFTLAHGRWQAR